MDFPYGQTVVRLRAGLVNDPYAGTSTRSDWENPDEQEIPGAFVAQSSTARITSATRTQALESKSLYCPPSADVRAGDRVVAGDETFVVDGVPTADVNPFTGWQPVREVPLERMIG